MTKEPIEVIEIRLISGDNPLRAFVDLRFGDFLVVRDFRIYKEDGRRLYVKVPFATYKDQMGQLKFRPIVILPDEVRGEVDLAILNAYQREMEKQSGSRIGK